MSHIDRDETDPAAAVEWLGLSDALLRGVGHAMNNRVAALSGVVQVLTSGGEGGPLSDALTAESHRLLKNVELLRLLPRHWNGEREPLLPDDVVRSSLELVPLHAELPELKYIWEREGDLPPVLAEPSLLLHLLCMMITRVAEAALPRNARTVTIRGSADATTVYLGMSTHGAGAGQDTHAQEVSPERPIDVPAIQRLAARAGGELLMLENSEETFRLDFRLPTLSEARRREREGAES